MPVTARQQKIHFLIRRQNHRNSGQGDLTMILNAATLCLHSERSTCKTNHFLFRSVQSITDPHLIVHNRSLESRFLIIRFQLFLLNQALHFFRRITGHGFQFSNTSRISQPIFSELIIEDQRELNCEALVYGTLSLLSR